MRTHEGTSNARGLGLFQTQMWYRLGMVNSKSFVGKVLL